MKSVFVVAFLLYTSTGHDLKCYWCVSTKGWDECADVEVVSYCPVGKDRCFKAISSYKKKGWSIKGYSKGCLSAAECGNVEKSCIRKGFKCKVNCCSSDLCNNVALPVVKNTATKSRAMGPVVSAVVPLACAMVAFVR